MLKDYLTGDLLAMTAAELTAKKFSPGIDKMNAEAAAIWFSVNKELVVEDVLSGKYNPMPATGFLMAKQNGGYRQISSLTAIDTVICSCLAAKLTDITEPVFSDSAFAYRQGKGVQAALLRYCSMSDKYNYAAKIDPKACFDNISHPVLIEKLNQLLNRDTQFIRIIAQYIRQPVYLEGKIQTRTNGILQGSPLSPVLCNLYFDSLDKLLEAENIPFIRYADDVVAFSNDAEEINRYAEIISNYMIDVLKLSINKAKCIITSPLEITYLGNRFTRSHIGANKLVRYFRHSETYIGYRQV